MAEPYRKVGRGGAGNFYSQKDIEEVSKISGSSPDLEAQTSPDADPASQDQQQQQREPPEYQHTGRGGAGNWVQPSLLPSSSTSEQQASSSQSQNQPAPRPTTTAYRSGRGGAGNYVEPDIRDREDNEGGRERKRRLEEGVERDVERSLARPERAYGGVGRGNGEVVGDGVRE